ncbi:MAG: adenylate/guanylate cyclase domain-containing protein, partial [Bacteroidota bacterium]
YVGDEVVISWRMDAGKFRNNAVQVFFSCQAAIQEKADHFIREYGAVPEFKAGMHAGPVMTGELGRIKKELVYSGVAISAASRIQHLCRQLSSDFLISEHLFHRLDLGQKVAYDNLGAFSLKGVEEQVNLIKIEKPLENLYFEASKPSRSIPVPALKMFRS